MTISHAIESFYADAIESFYADAIFTITDGILIWQDERPQPTEEEIQSKIQELQVAEPMRQLRIKRNQLISETDWWVLPDRTPTPEQLDYRQALRDLTANSTPALDEDGNLTGVTWPEKPE